MSSVTKLLFLGGLLTATDDMSTIERATNSTLTRGERISVESGIVVGEIIDGCRYEKSR